MLKIKDNVDLKELEKYGFGRKYIIDSWAYTIDYQERFYTESLTIWEVDRSIQISHAIKLLPILYDLIKADLVEKVED